MRRLLAVLTITLLAALGLAGVASAASPHFVGTPTASRSGGTLTVSFKIAGLGNDDQAITLTADAQCVNPGNNEPQAENKGALLATGTFSPKNGQVTGSLSGSATTDPACNPPMELRYANVTVTDVTAGISYTLPGTY